MFQGRWGHKGILSNWFAQQCRWEKHIFCYFLFSYKFHRSHILWKHNLRLGQKWNCWDEKTTSNKKTWLLCNYPPNKNKLITARLSLKSFILDSKETGHMTLLKKQKRIFQPNINVQFSYPKFSLRLKYAVLRTNLMHIIVDIQIDLMCHSL